MKRILVVDDEDSIRLLLRDELTEAGYEVITASNGEEALALIEQSKPDLITLDIKMPHMDGAEFLRRIRQIHRDLPVVIFTAYDDFRQDFRLWASDVFVTKSSDLGELKQRISHLLGNGP
jgi:CheY-like chemotaxis protein